MGGGPASEAWFGGGYGGDRGMFDGSFSYMGMSGMMLEVYFNMHQDQQPLISGHYYKNGRMIADWIKSQEEVAEAVTFGTVLPEVEVKGGLRIWQWGEWRTKMRKRYGVAVPFVESTFNKFAYDQDGKDPWVRAKRMGYMPWNPDAMTISIPVSATYGAGYAGSLDLTLANDGIGLGFTAGSSFGTPNVSIGVGISLTEATNGSGNSIDDLVGGDGSSYSGGIGPVGIQYSQSYNKYGQITAKSYGVSIELSSRDFGTIGSVSASPLSHQFAIFKWKFYEKN